MSEHKVQTRVIVDVYADRADIYLIRAKNSSLASDEALLTAHNAIRDKLDEISKAGA